MNGWLLDTSALSAFAPGKPAVAPDVARWFEDHSENLFLSTITVIEIETGIAKLDRTGATRRAEILRNWHGQILGSYTEKVLPLDLTAARIAGSLGDAAIATGRYPGFADVAIAAIAKSQDLAVLTLNLRHFEPLGVAASNPFSPD